MTTTIRDINELQDRRIMMEKKLPPFGYALILLTAALILFLVVWSTKNYRTYIFKVRTHPGTFDASFLYAERAVCDHIKAIFFR